MTKHLKSVNVPSLLQVENIMMWRGEEYATTLSVLPQTCLFGVRIFLSWRKSRPKRLRKSFYLSLNYIKEFRERVCTRKSAITKDEFLYMKDLSVKQGKHLLTKHLLFSSSCDLSFSPLKPETLCPISSTQNGI